MPPLSRRRVDQKEKPKQKETKRVVGIYQRPLRWEFINIHRLLSRRTGDDMSFAHDKKQHKKGDASPFPPDV
jgi:hypothetical protein